MDNHSSYKAFFYFLGNHKRLYSGVLAFIIVGSLFEGFSLAAFFPVFNSVFNESEPASGILGLTAKAVTGLPISNPLVAAAFVLIAVFFLKTIVMLIRVWITAHASAKVLYDVKKQVLERYANAEYQFFLDNQQGTLVYNSTAAPASVSAALLHGSTLIANLTRIIAMFGLLVLTFPLAALGFAAIGILYYGIIYKLSKKISFNIGVDRASVGREQGITVNEFFTGIRQIFASDSTKPWVERFDLASAADRDLFRREQVWAGTPRHVMELVGVASFLGFVIILASTSPGGLTNTLPKLGVFAVAMVQILPSLNSIGGMWMTIMTRLPNVQFAYEAVTDPVPRRPDGNVRLESFEQRIVFEDVSFAHKGRETLLKDVNLAFEKGKRTAIVGQSGSGKTTIINLVLGLFGPSEGKISVDGIPLMDIKQETWLKRIGFVSQETFTYHTTVEANILFGRGGFSREDVINAAKVANSHDFISDLPDGYDTVVADWGMTLSGGQQQRLAIARAVLDSPEILIFDEATSSLDNISEKLVQEAIDSVSHDRTVIVIAHRLSTIRSVDRIIVLEDGRVLEQGTYDDLISRQDHFARLAGLETTASDL